MILLDTSELAGTVAPLPTMHELSIAPSPMRAPSRITESLSLAPGETIAPGPIEQFSTTPSETDPSPNQLLPSLRPVENRLF